MKFIILLAVILIPLIESSSPVLSDFEVLLAEARKYLTPTINPNQPGYDANAAIRANANADMVINKARNLRYDRKKMLQAYRDQLCTWPRNRSRKELAYRIVYTPIWRSDRPDRTDAEFESIVNDGLFYMAGFGIYSREFLDEIKHKMYEPHINRQTIVTLFLQQTSHLPEYADCVPYAGAIIRDATYM